MHILIADDDATNLKLLRVTLEAEGHRVISAMDGVEALAIAEREKPDAIISDILMPRMDGYRLCHELRRNANFRTLPFIVYTSTYTSPSDEKAALDMGADKFLKKPAPSNEIVKALEEAVQSAPHRQSIAGDPAQELELMKEYNERLVVKLEHKNSSLEEQAESLRKSDARKQAIFVSALDAIIELDHEGHIVEFNPAAGKTLGLIRAEALGKDMAELIVSPASRERYWRELNRARTGGKGEPGGERLEMTAIRKDGTEFPIELTLTWIGETEPPMLMAFIRDITERKQAESEVHQSRDQLRAFAARLQAAREEERTRISRELHDELGAVLTGVKLGLAWMRDRLGQNEGPVAREPCLERIEELVAVANGAAERVHKLCADLRPSVLDHLGLASAIEWQLQEFEARTNIRCESTLQTEHLILGEKQVTGIFRIFQEILTNVSNHAQASSVRVHLRDQGSSLILEVKDNGKGIEPEQIAGSKSLGLLGMRERAALLGGKVEIRGRRGKGTTVTLTVPIP